MYKPQIAIIGSRELSPDSLLLLKALSFELVSKGYRTVTGGLGTLQQTVHEGAKSNPQHTDCDTIVLLPGFDPKPAISYADVIIPTGLDAYRNALVANSEVVVVIGGGAGTLSEMAFAWQFKRPIIAIGKEGGPTVLLVNPSTIDNHLRLLIVHHPQLRKLYYKFQIKLRINPTDISVFLDCYYLSFQF